MDGNEPGRPLVRVICGPTAAGKSQTAMACAELAEISIVSADSRQLYRGFDVGTAKPTGSDRRVVPHYGIDVLDPVERASAAWWATAADEWVGESIATRRLPLVVGGTGLYLRALFGALFHEPPMDPVRRAALQAELGGMATERLRRWVERLDPARAHLGRTQLLRAAEVALLLGRRVSELQRERPTVPRWRARYLVVDPGAALRSRIADRTRVMLSTGWVEEVGALMQRVPPDAPAWNAAGYRTIREVVQGTLTVAQAEERVVIETRQYAKRQRTWFRHQIPAVDATPLDPCSRDWRARVRAWWEGASA